MKLTGIVDRETDPAIKARPDRDQVAAEMRQDFEDPYEGTASATAARQEVATSVRESEGLTRAAPAEAAASQVQRNPSGASIHSHDGDSSHPHKIDASTDTDPDGGGEDNEEDA